MTDVAMAPQALDGDFRQGPHRIEPDARVTLDVAARRVVLDGSRKQVMETARNRLMVTSVVFAVLFGLLGVRLVELTTVDGAGPRTASKASTPAAPVYRADILDRNGVVLATSLPTASLYADPKDILDPAAATDKLMTVLPGLNRQELLAKLKSRSRFVWIKRNLTPAQKYAVNRLGLPGLAFQSGEKRVYPHGPAVSHILGLTDVDGKGTAGIEKRFDEVLSNSTENLKLSIDVRAQTVLREELMAAVTEFRAVGAAGVVLDVDTGEAVAMVSLPDFDPNEPLGVRASDARFNRTTKGVYEMGSTFKLFTAAMALDNGTTNLTEKFDATKPLRVARFTISDYHAKNKWMTVPEILVHSSNIGSAKIAQAVGGEGQRDYLGRLGLLQSAAVELPEVGAPLVPARWREINTMTISYGHGIAVSPLQLVGAVATVVNGGVQRPVTVLAQDKPPAGKQVLKTKTSDMMRNLMRMVVENGTGRNADAKGYLVGGKTGTAEKQGRGGYKKKSLISSFVGAFPMNAPRYVVLAMLDEPKGNKRTYNYATGGWVAAPVVRRVVERLGPMFGVRPVADDGEAMRKGRKFGLGQKVVAR